MINVMISDPDLFAREGIKQMLANFSDLRVTCEAQSSLETFQVLNTFRPDVCIVEIAVDDHYGLGFVRETKSRSHGAPILVVSHRHERGFGLRAIRAGAAGYLDKSCSDEELAHAVRLAASNRAYLSGTLCELIAESMLDPKEQPPHERLSDRDFEIFVLLAHSMPVARIAAACSISIAMARLHKKRIMKRMGLDTDASIVLYAIEHGLIEHA